VLLAWLWSALLHVLTGPWIGLVWLAAGVALLRYALLAVAALLVRPWPWKLVLLPSVLLWGLLDLLSITGVFSVYGLLRPAEDFVHFQF
jgi:predicted tellurium resistance membrane protein TerC